jgi:hypothetical protein
MKKVKRPPQGAQAVLQLLRQMSRLSEECHPEWPGLDHALSVALDAGLNGPHRDEFVAGLRRWLCGTLGGVCYDLSRYDPGEPIVLEEDDEDEDTTRRAVQLIKRVAQR